MASLAPLSVHAQHSTNPDDPMAQLAVVLLALFGQMERTYTLERAVPVQTGGDGSQVREVPAGAVARRHLLHQLTEADRVGWHCQWSTLPIFAVPVQFSRRRRQPMLLEAWAFASDMEASRGGDTCLSHRAS
jgi:hypothetical protein